MREVLLVIRPKTGVAQVRVSVDGEGQYFGESVQSGKVIVDVDRLYKLVNLPTPGQHTLRLEFLDENVEFYAFTFG